MKQIFNAPPKGFRNLILRNWANFSRVFLLVVLTMGVLVPTNRVFAQAVLECHSPDPTPQEYAELVAQVPLIKEIAAGRRGSSNIDIPVYVHVIRNTNGMIPYGQSVDINQIMQGLNESFAPAGINFVLIGEVNYLDRDKMGDFLWRWSRFSYITSALNIYIGSSQNFTNQPNTVILDTARIALNMATCGHIDANYNGGAHLLSHEVGHSLGLLHTFGPTTTYMYPPSSNQIDHPYSSLAQFKRELVIRDTTPGKTFPYPNCNFAGDLCCDTHADCSPNFIKAFPDFQSPLNCNTTPCISGCIRCDSTLSTYRDYNGDLAPGEIGNLMNNHDCAHGITPQQAERVIGSFDIYWKNKYETASDVNIADYVEFMNTNFPLNQVVIQYRHPNSPSKYCNSFSNKDGKIQGVIYDSVLMATIRKLGSKDTLINGNPQGTIASHFVDQYTREDWEQGVDACDVIKIRRYIQSQDSINGWQMIAANVAMGVGGAPISTFDIHYLKGFIAGVHPTFAQYSAPWRFVPEYIPADYASQFNVNPFNMNINGVQVLNAAYTEPSWEYTITDGFNSKSGYDGIHLGDVDIDHFGCVDMFRCSTGVDVPMHSIMLPGNTYALNFEVSGTTNLQALQLGMHVDPKITIKDVLAGDLDDFDPTNDIGVNTIGQDEVRVIWVPDAPVSLGNTSSNNNNAPVLMTWHVEVSEPVLNLSSLISLQDSILQNMAIKDQGCGQYTYMTISVDNLSDSRNAMDGKVATDKMWCMPNPAGSNMTVIIESTSTEAATLTVFDLNGKLVYRYETNLQKGANTVSLGENVMKGLLPGLYNAVLTKASGSSSIRFVKQ